MKHYAFRNRWKALAVATLDRVGEMLVRPFSGNQPRPIEKAATFLIVRLDHLGDVLQATSLPKLLKENFHLAKVLVVVSSQAAPLFDHNPFVDEVIMYDAPWFALGRFKPKSGAHTFGSLIAALKARKIDVGFSLRGDLRENYLLWRAGIKTRIGYGITGGGFFLTREPHYRLDAHETERSLDLIRALGVSAQAAFPKIYFSEVEEHAFSAKLAEWGIDGKPMALFQVAAGASSKNWPIDSVNLFMIAFSARFPSVNLVIVGNDRTVLHPLLGVIDLRGRTSVRELALLSKHAVLFVGPDSGPTHLASAVGTPSIFLYSGTNEFARWKPLSENAVALKNDVSCAPCALNDCVVEGHPCMSGIPVQAALDAAGGILRLP